jgi:hypothetical protein
MLEALDRAAGHNHQQEMLRITKQLLDGCVVPSDVQEVSGSV